jgi:hypothetical protein
MNIFVLDQSPAIAASYHCDQHIHKMILESAQMLSTAMHTWYPHLSGYLYKPAHPNHPCTIWISANKENAFWVAELMYHLNQIRLDLGSNDHASMFIYTMFHNNYDYMPGTKQDDFIFAGPLQYKLRPDLDIYQKYQEYYKLKQKLWLDTKRPMSYSNRSVPFFLQDAIK